MKIQPKIIIAGGGTGGHIFPAIAIANALKEKIKEADILFVGALGKMEMEKVPAAGYKIEGLPIQGFQRKLTFKNIIFFFKLFQSLLKAKKIVKTFKPDVVVGVGGYSSGPILKIATRHKIPTLIQEQNSYAGVTNKLLASKVNKICVAYENMDRFFPKEKIILTGNPIRTELLNSKVSKSDSKNFFKINENKKVILILGGSLGAKTINESVISKLDLIKKHPDIEIILQSGKYYFENIKRYIADIEISNLKLFDFISRMDYAYNASDLVISRAGAISISELCLLGKPAILVPSPNVAEDHQTKNAMSLAERDAAVIVKDIEARDKLINVAFDLIFDDNRLKALSVNSLKMGMKDSDLKIAEEILKLI